MWSNMALSVSYLGCDIITFISSQIEIKTKQRNKIIIVKIYAH